MSAVVAVRAHERMRQIHAAHGGALRSFLLRLTMGDAHLADDLMQDTMLRAWRHLDGLPSEPAQLRPWLFVVARRAFVDMTRRRRVRDAGAAVFADGNVPTTADHAQRVSETRTVRTALAALSDEHRRVLVELFYHDVAPRELAARLDVPEGTIRSRRFYALRSLAEIIGPPD